ncbi:MAG: autotransporter-associated beta strand repeat-containing protein, partial [Chlamydiia bacterium]
MVLRFFLWCWCLIQGLNLAAANYQITTLASSGAGSLVNQAAVATANGDTLQFVITAGGQITLANLSPLSIVANITLYNSTGFGSITVGTTAPNLFSIAGNVTNFTIGTPNFDGPIIINAPMVFNNAAAPAVFNLNAFQLSLLSNISLGENWSCSFNRDFVTSGITLGSTLSNTINVAASRTVTMNGVVAGSGFVKTGTGGLILSNDLNSYTGVTDVQQGTLFYTLAGSVSTLNKGVNIATGAILNIGGCATGITFNGISGNGLLSLGTKRFTSNTVTANASFAGTITGTGVFTKSGPFTQVLSGVSSYTGVTTITEGTLSISGAGSISSSGQVTVDATTASATLAIDNASGTVTLRRIAGSGNIRLGANSLQLLYPNSSEFSGTISGTGGIIKTGSGTMSLSGVNTYTGLTDIRQGILALTTAGTIITQAAVNIEPGAVFSFVRIDPVGLTLGSLSGGGNVSLGAKILTINAATTGSSFNGIISGSQGIVKTGSLALTLSGISIYTGTTTLSEGVLSLSGAGSISLSNSLNVATSTLNPTQGFFLDQSIVG